MSVSVASSKGEIGVDVGALKEFLVGLNKGKNAMGNMKAEMQGMMPQGEMPDEMMADEEEIVESQQITIDPKKLGLNLKQGSPVNLLVKATVVKLSPDEAVLNIESARSFGT